MQLAKTARHASHRCECPNMQQCTCGRHLGIALEAGVVRQNERRRADGDADNRHRQAHKAPALDAQRVEVAWEQEAWL